VGEGPAEIRRRIQALRKAQDPEQAHRFARSICKRLLAAIAPRAQGLNIAIYRSLPEELDPSPLAEALALAGARLFYPRVVDVLQSRMEFIEMDAQATWVAGPFGIQEPDPALPAAAAGTLDLIVVPGVAFGEKGGRIGRGAGFYDRALTHQVSALRVALAFDFQVLARVPQEPHDQPVDWVLTETRDLRNSKAATWLRQP
jgi:5-formyltetrahydrofolate cyclo-ligase